MIGHVYGYLTSRPEGCVQAAVGVVSCQAEIGHTINNFGSDYHNLAIRLNCKLSAVVESTEVGGDLAADTERGVQSAGIQQGAFFQLLQPRLEGPPGG